MNYKYLLYIAKSYSIPIFTPIVQYLKEKEIDFSFYISNKVKDNFPQNWNEYTIFQHLKDAINYKPDFVLVSGNFVDFHIPGIKVQLFHGLGIEKKSHFKIRHFFDVYLTSGPFVTEKFKKLLQKYKYFLVEETGWSKIDYILNYPKENLRKKYDIEKNEKVILYAPTFSKKMQSAKELLPIIPEIIRNDEIWLIKFHELMNKEIIQKYEENKPENIKIIKSINITPYLHIADVLISDTSSVIYEFMVLDKPIITFRTQSRFDKGINILNTDELRTAIDRSFKNPDEFHENRIKHLNEINPYLDGNISKNIIEKLQDIKIHNRLPKKKKPLNLFRKFQILYHGKYRKGYLR